MRAHRCGVAASDTDDYKPVVDTSRFRLHAFSAPCASG
jgi:hypothetical protein